ncbi:MAG TPA: D-alanine--D-alanine ligase [Ignavibacteria bacterium]|nr:D-alanine--D-alanine ligase [Ignavibacteria bacterium]
MKNKNLIVALLVGGASPEREVSKDSSRSIYNALINLGYDVKLIDPAYGENQPDEIEGFFAEKEYSEISSANYVDAVNSNLFEGIDIAFLGLHGKYGEDGLIQALLELREIKYTGSDVSSSSIAMNKEMAKILFNHFNVNTPKWISINKNFDIKDLISKIENQIGFPCVVKPNNQGSTVGLTICKDENSVEEAVSLSLNFSGKVLIEEYISGRELTVAVLEDKALPVLEIKPEHGLYDYECKYTEGKSQYIVPAEIPEEVAKFMRKEALTAFKALGCSVYGRMDFRLSESNVPYCLEVNTLPGMTSTSLVPKMAKAVEISFDDLIDKIIKLSL